MALSDVIADMILEMINETEGYAEIQRNELAERVGCVPSQINYVLTSRFTPEHGYIVESRRGGGGFIKITRVSMDEGAALMHIVNNVGDSIDEKVCFAMINNLMDFDFLRERDALMMKVALSNKSYRNIPPECKDILRATIFKRMLVAVASDQNSIKNKGE